MEKSPGDLEEKKRAELVMENKKELRGILEEFFAKPGFKTSKIYAYLRKRDKQYYVGTKLVKIHKLTTFEEADRLFKSIHCFHNHKTRKMNMSYDNESKMFEVDICARGLKIMFNKSFFPGGKIDIGGIKKFLKDSVK